MMFYLIIITLGIIIIYFTYECFYLKKLTIESQSSLINFINTNETQYEELSKIKRLNRELIFKSRFQSSDNIIDGKIIEVLIHANHYLLLKNTNYYYHHFINILHQSEILTSIEDISLLYHWISKTRNNDLNKIQLKLLYRASLHGDKMDDFHSRCDYQETTISLIKVNPSHDTKKNNEYYIFGGFTTISFDSLLTKRITDDHTFIFSLTNKQKYITERYFVGIFTGYLTFLNYGNVMSINPEWKGKPDGMTLRNPYTDENSYKINFDAFPFNKTNYNIEDIEIFGITIDNK